MSLLHADCSVCGYHRHLSEDVLRSYKLDEVTKVTIPVAYGWCERCAQVTAVEALPSLAKIDTDIALAAAADNDARWREHLQALRRWRANRTAPAKCLECGSTHFQQFDEVQESDDLDESDEEYRPLIHPGCGGKLTVNAVGFSRSGAWIFYTPEGDKIAAYDVYASRGLVPRPDDAEQAAPPDRGGE